MTIKQFKKHIEQFPFGTTFPHGISNPFSWRGSYNEVCFSIELNSKMDREVILSRINKALQNSFKGWKGGEYEYDENTNVNFERGERNYSNSTYAEEVISEIDNSPYKSPEQRLIEIAFSQNVLSTP